ncbi:MAG: polysaccharide biosynthesis/export family protein [Parvibaculaceae bacterium]
MRVIDLRSAITTGALLALALLVAGCSGSAPVPGQQASMQPVADSRTASTAASQFMSADPAAPDLETYRLGNQDMVQITVFQVPELSQTVRVSDNVIVLPLIGKVPAAGRTVPQLQADIASRASRYLQSPQVSVNIAQFNSQQITVEGSVRRPGIFPVSSHTTLLQSIALAQGFDPVADPGNVVVFRNVNGQRQAARFDVAEIRGGNASDPTLQSGDVVVVPKNGLRSALQDVLQALPIGSTFTRM